MKKLAVLAACLLLSFSASAQAVISEILVNSFDPQTGLRSLATDQAVVRNGMTDRNPIKVGLMAVELPDGWHYSLSVAVTEYVSRAIPEGAILLIKTSKGEVIELKNTLDEITSQDFSGEVVTGSSVLVYENRANYQITQEQLMTIGRTGVQKIRLQRAGDYFDTEYKKDQWAKVISAHLLAVQAEIRKDKDIRSDF